MKRFFLAGLVLILAGCSTGPSVPQAGYTGTWKGEIQYANGPVTVVTVTTQSDSTISGTGNYIAASGNQPFTVTGMSSRPDIHFTMVFNDSTSLSFAGEYVTSDSVAGVIELAPSIGSPTLSMKRQ